jgi:hypothetical protein
MAGKYAEAGPVGYKSVVLPPAKASAWGGRAQFEHHELAGFQYYRSDEPYKGLAFRGKWNYDASDSVARPVDTPDGWRTFESLIRQVYNLGGTMGFEASSVAQYRMFKYCDRHQNQYVYTSCSVPQRIMRRRSMAPIVLRADDPRARMVFGRRENDDGNTPILAGGT